MLINCSAACISSCQLLQVLYSIPGADITNNPSLLATFVLNLIFIFGLLVGVVPVFKFMAMAPSPCKCCTVLACQ